MARTASNMLALGTTVPQFSLPDVVSGRIISSGEFAGNKGLLVMFICSHCPYVKHVQRRLGEITQEYAAKGLGVVGISSNDPSDYPEDSPEGLRKQARENGFTFPYLFDESQKVARAFKAACTPDFYLFDSTQKLVYRGQFDESRPKNDVPVDGRDLRAAMDAVLAGEPVSADQRPSIGCNIKWKQPHA